MDRCETNANKSKKEQINLKIRQIQASIASLREPLTISDAGSLAGQILLLFGAIFTAPTIYAALSSSTPLGGKIGFGIFTVLLLTLAAFCFWKGLKQEKARRSYEISKFEKEIESLQKQLSELEQ